MIEIARILCPIDFSEYSRHAFDCALAVARWYGSTITALHVYPYWPPVDAIPPITPQTIQPAVPGDVDPEELTSRMRAFVGQQSSLPPVRVDLQVDSAPDICHSIVAHARASNPDLIVTGSHGRSGLKRLVLGSVTEKLVRQAPCPVMVAPARVAEAAAAAVHFKHILCAVDFSNVSLAALTYAMSLAEEADACLTVVHVLETPPELLVPSSRQGIDVDEVRAEAEADTLRRLRALIPDSVRTYCTVETAVAEGKASRQILKLADERQIELIVMGVQGRGAIDLLTFGSHTQEVIRGAVCPVLTIRAR
jgi:nucleotide-binding universal stress UspA family protein